MSADPPPNLLVLTAHDLGRYLPCYGVDVRSPNVERIAAEGVVFENAFAASTTCAPSRASLDTGLLPHNHGLFGHPKNDSPPDAPWFGWEMNDVRTTPMYLGDLGYTSYLCGLQHETTTVERLGYDRVRHHHEYGRDPDKFGTDMPARAMAEEVRGVIEREADREGPFYVQANAHNVHAPFSRREGGHREDPVPGFEPVAPGDVDVPRFLEGTPDVREALVQLREDLYELDYAVGEVLDALEEQDLAEDTLVVFTTDHGLPFAGGAKSTVFDDGIGTALLARLPGRIRAGSREDALISNVDVLPTLVDYAGGTPPAGIDGRSVRPLLAEEPYDEREAVFAEMTWTWPRDPYSPIRAVRTREYKYARNLWPFSNGRQHFREPIDGEPGEYYAALDNREGMRPEEELYHLPGDATEEENVIDDPEHADAARRLRGRLRARLIADDAPITRGPIPPVGFDATF